MSFWSSYELVRSAPPPVVTGAAIAAFVRELDATGLVVPDALPFSCEIKYGKRIDSDYETTDLVEWDKSGIIGTTREYPWDRKAKSATLVEIADSLANDNRAIYRASLMLGAVDPDIQKAITRPPSAENAHGFEPFALSFSIGPANVQGLASDEPAAVGWMSLTISGPGYFFPWTFRERAVASNPAPARIAWRRSVAPPGRCHRHR